MIDKDRKRQRALIFIRVLSLCQLAFCPLLFTLGGVGQGLHGGTSGGVKYYAGAYVAATLVVFPAITGLVIYHKGVRCFSTTTAAIKLGCLMPTYWVFLALSSLGYIISAIITGIAGVCSGDDCVYESNMSQNNRMAIAILLTLLVLLMTNTAGIVTLCLSEKYFGLTLFKRGQRRIANSSLPRPPTREAVVISRSTTPHPNAHPQIIHNLQMQNQQLQQQLLFNQQQQLSLLHGPPQMSVHFAGVSDDPDTPPEPEPNRHRKQRRHRFHPTAPPEPPTTTDGYTLPPIHGARPQPLMPPPYQQPHLEPPPYTP